MTLVLFASTGLQPTLSILVLLVPFLFPSSPPSWFFTPSSSASRCLRRPLRWTRIVPIPCAAFVVSSSKSLCSSARDHGRLVKQSGLFSSGFHFCKWLRRSKSSFLETYTLWCIYCYIDPFPLWKFDLLDLWSIWLFAFFKSPPTNPATSPYFFGCLENLFRISPPRFFLQFEIDLVGFWYIRFLSFSSSPPTNPGIHPPSCF
jgi:hypothetical protein